MTVEANCPICKGQGFIDEKAPPHYNTDVKSTKCGKCKGEGSVKVEVTCWVCDNGVIKEEGIGFCSEKCYKADIKRAIDGLAERKGEV